MSARVVELMTDLGRWADDAGNHPAGVGGYGRSRLRGGGVVESHPLVCLNGHMLVPPNYRGSWLPCTCAGPEHGHGHRVVGCVECGHEWFYPPHTDTTATAQHWATTRASTE